MRIQVAGNKKLPSFGDLEYAKEWDKTLVPQRKCLCAKYDSTRVMDAYFCEICGTEVFAQWYYLSNKRHYVWDNANRCIDHYVHDETGERISAAHEEYAQTCIKEREDFLKSEISKICPLCGSEFSKIQYHGNGDVPGKGYSADSSVHVFPFLHEEHEKQLKNDAEFAARSFVTNLQNKYSFGTISLSNNTSIKFDVAELKSYILSLIQLETDILRLPEYLANLQMQYYRIKGEVHNADMEPFMEVYSAYQDALSRAKQCREKPPKTQLPVQPQEPYCPTFKKPGLFNKKKIEAENKTLEEKYNADKKAYQQKMEEYHQQVVVAQKVADEKHHLAILSAEKEVEQAKQAVEAVKSNLFSSTTTSPKTKVLDLLHQEITKVEELLKKLYQTRSEMYALNVVFEKYRNLVALSTFYEYLMAGRCETLEGTNGAYNLYEAEVRANMIISQLSEVLESLDKIQQTQYMVYTQLKNMNKTMDLLSYSMESACSAIMDIKHSTAQIEKSSDVIAFNTASAAHYAKVNADLTNALGFMVAMK